MARRSARKAAQVVLVARPSPPDAAGARQRQTPRAGSIWLKSFGFRLGRGATTTFTETLDLEPNGLRQSDPEFTENALEPGGLAAGSAAGRRRRCLPPRLRELPGTAQASRFAAVSHQGQARRDIVHGLDGRRSWFPCVEPVAVSWEAKLTRMSILAVALGVKKASAASISGSDRHALAHSAVNANTLFERHV